MAWRKGTLEADKKKRLDDIGFVWEAGTGGSGSEDFDFDNGKIKPEHGDNQTNTGYPADAPDFGRDSGVKERHREEHVTRRGRLKLEEAKSFDDWCALLQEVHCRCKRSAFLLNYPFPVQGQTRALRR